MHTHCLQILLLLYVWFGYPKHIYITEEEVEEVSTLVKPRIPFPTNNLKKQNSIAEHVRFYGETSLGCIFSSHITTETITNAGACVKTETI